MRSPFLTCFLTVASCVAISASAFAQPTWRFHLAFENGDGARDTIWMVYDPIATYPSNPWPGPNVDTLLGEAGIDIDANEFHVWVLNAIGDSTKTNAHPYTYYPSFDGTIINAVNWVAPITIRWDTSLFHAPYLPGPDTIGVASMGGSYFFGHNNNPDLQAFDMLLTDSVVIDEDAFMLFSFGVYFAANSWLTTEEPSKGEALVVVPNPTTGPMRVVTSEEILRSSVIDALGRVVHHEERSKDIDIGHLPNGLYTLRLVATNNHTYHVQLVKEV